LAGGFIKAQPEIGPSMLPSDVDGGFHVVGQDDELGRPAVVIAPKTHDVKPSHSGRENSEKLRGEQGGLDSKRSARPGGRLNHRWAGLERKAGREFSLPSRAVNSEKARAGQEGRAFRCLAPQDLVSVIYFPPVSRWLSIAIPARCQSIVANCQDKHRSKDYSFMIMTLQEIEERMDELSRRLVETHDKKIIKELYDLALELEKVEKLEKQ
jgi:hypothetical protein